VLSELGPWWWAAQLFIRWAKLGVWPRLLEAAQTGGVDLGMALLDGSIRAHAKAAGQRKRGDLTPARPQGSARPLAGLTRPPDCLFGCGSACHLRLTDAA
jgi:hypothetical protein